MKKRDKAASDGADGAAMRGDQRRHFVQRMQKTMYEGNRAEKRQR
jgi:hypothetical protein